jgi:predicted tellurium resistance membrane protein TerC
MFEFLATPELLSAALVSLLTLTALEIVLGIDNIVFISVLVARLPEEQAKRARQIGLALALGFRVALLTVLVWIIGLTQPLFTLFGHDFSWKDLILIAGGLFLFYKATHEIHNEIDGRHEEASGAVSATMSSVVFQIVIIDAVFSIDSIVTAVGLADHIEIMIAAVVIAIGIMYISSGPIADFVAKHPTTKMLALAFLFMIGVTLVADGLGFHIPKGYIYAAMAFSTAVEVINVWASNRRKARQAGRAES